MSMRQWAGYPVWVGIVVWVSFFAVVVAVVALTYLILRVAGFH